MLHDEPAQPKDGDTIVVERLAGVRVHVMHNDHSDVVLQISTVAGSNHFVSMHPDDLEGMAERLSLDAHILKSGEFAGRA
jgi:hypothetical protein